MTEKTAKTAKDPVEVTDDSVTLNVGDEKVTLTEENVVKSGKQLLKATLLTVGLILGGAVVGAVAGAMIFPARRLLLPRSRDFSRAAFLGVWSAAKLSNARMPIKV